MNTRDELQAEQDLVVGHILIPARMIQRRMLGVAMLDGDAAYDGQMRYMLDTIESRSDYDIENSIAYFARLRANSPDNYQVNARTFDALDALYRREKLKRLAARRHPEVDEPKTERRM